MLPGFNHNVQHKGLLFHVQTEDGGLKNPVVVTTLFYAGNVIANRRTSYAKFTKAGDLTDIVSTIMKEQHKDMMKDLIHDRLRSVQMVFETSIGTPAKTTPSAQPNSPKIVEKPVAPESKPLQVGEKVDKSLDELILEFLKTEPEKKS